MFVRKDKFANDDRWCREYQRDTMVTDCILYALAPLRGEDARYFIDHARSIWRMAESNRLSYRVHNGDAASQEPLARLQRQMNRERTSRYEPASLRAAIEEGLAELSGDPADNGRTIAKTIINAGKRHDDTDIVRRLGKLFEHSHKYVNNAYVRHTGRARINFERLHQAALQEADRFAEELAARHRDFKIPGLADHFRQALNMSREIVLSAEPLLLDGALKRLGRGRGRE